MKINQDLIQQILRMSSTDCNSSMYWKFMDYYSYKDYLESEKSIRTSNQEFIGRKYDRYKDLVDKLVNLGYSKEIIFKSIDEIESE